MYEVKPDYTEEILWIGTITNPGSSISDTSLDHMKYIDIDLREKYSFNLLISLGLLTEYSALDNGIDINLRRTGIDFNGNLIDNPVDDFSYHFQADNSYNQTVLTGSSGDTAVELSDIPLSEPGDLVFFNGSDLSELEFGRVVYNDGVDSVILDSPIQLNHDGHDMIFPAYVLSPIQLIGGSHYRLTITAGEYQTVSAEWLAKVVIQTNNFNYTV